MPDVTERMHEQKRLAEEMLETGVIKPLEKEIENKELEKEADKLSKKLEKANADEIEEMASQFIVNEMTHDEYLTIPYISSTVLRAYEKNPSLLKNKEGHGNKYYQLEIETTTSMTFGNVLHKSILERDKFLENPETYTCLLTPHFRKMLLPCIDGIVKNPHAMEFIDNAEHKELPLIFGVNVDNDKVKCKSKADLISVVKGKRFLVDIKTCQELEEIPRSIYKYRYDLQLSFHREACIRNSINIDGVVIIGVEKNNPNESHVYLISEDKLKTGEFGDLDCRGWRQIIKELWTSPRNRFEHPVTLIE